MIDDRQILVVLLLGQPNPALDVTDRFEILFEFLAVTPA